MEKEMDIKTEEVDVIVADDSHEQYVDLILETIENAAKVRGTGIAKRSHEYVTQATLSRDMKELRIVKKHDENNLYVYALPDETSSTVSETDDSRILSIEFSGNLAVLKTRPGYAMAIAFEIDKYSPREIAGTIAGDDTILIIPREGFSRERVAAALANYIT